jgi:exosortase
VDRDRVSWIGLLLLTVVGLGFIWVPYSIRMWAAGHYQFFPLVFLAVGILLWSRRAELAFNRSPADGRLLAPLLVSVIVLAIFSNLLYSSFLGIIATVLAIWVGVYAVFGWGGVRVAAPVLALLVFAIPLPMHLDEALIVRMQLLASDFASRFLDGIGVIHFRQGVILQTQNTQFLTEEACSGIRSLFSSWAVVAIVSVAMRHRWWRFAINMAQTVVWVMLGNILRIVLVVALADVAPWLGTGWGHELLGLGVFAFILAMIASTDTAVSGLISNELVIETRDESPILPGYGGENANAGPAVELPPFPLADRPRMVVFAGLVVLALVSMRAEWVRSGWTATVQSLASRKLPAPHEADLPEALAGLERTSFTHTSRGPNFLWAQDSYLWEYRRGPLVAIVSLDTPWNEWHNLDHCYRNIGWQTEPQFGLLPPQPSSEALAEYRHSELLMHRAGNYGFVVFSAIDRNGNYVAEGGALEAADIIADPAVLFAHTRAALGLGGQRANVLTADRLPVSTVQLYAESTLPWTGEDLKRLRDLFLEAREKLVSRQAQVGGGS